jgi:hypothetical protein
VVGGVFSTECELKEYFTFLDQFYAIDILLSSYSAMFAVCQLTYVRLHTPSSPRFLVMGASDIPVIILVVDRRCSQDFARTGRLIPSTSLEPLFENVKHAHVSTFAVPLSMMHMVQSVSHYNTGRGSQPYCYKSKHLLSSIIGPLEAKRRFLRQ